MNLNAPPVFSNPSFRGRVGVARRDITPPTGIYSRMWGCASHDTAEGVHRPLLASVICFQHTEGGHPLILASLDLGWWIRAEDEWFLRGHLLERFNLDSAQLMLHLIHTHSGPSISLQHNDQPGGELIRPYLERLRVELGDAIDEALRQAEPCIVSWTAGRCNLAANRDLFEQDSGRVLCGFSPDASADDTLLVGRVTNDGGRPIAVLVNYACHPTTLGGDNRLLSPDYIGAMREVIENATPGARCLFMLGAAGELGPRQAYASAPEVADRYGRQLGYAVLSTLESMLLPGTQLQYTGAVDSGAPLAIWRPVDVSLSEVIEGSQTTVEIALKHLPTAKQLAGQLQKCRDRVVAEQLRRKHALRTNIGDGATLSLPYWVWRLGDAVFVGLPAEAHSIFQQELRHSFADQAVSVMNMVNGYFSYLPPLIDYSSRSYQVNVSLCRAGCLEELIDDCVNTTNELF